MVMIPLENTMKFVIQLQAQQISFNIKKIIGPCVSPTHAIIIIA